jgi:hypothetical protein
MTRFGSICSFQIGVLCDQICWSDFFYTNTVDLSVIPRHAPRWAAFRGWASPVFPFFSIQYSAMRLIFSERVVCGRHDAVIWPVRQRDVGRYIWATCSWKRLCWRAGFSFHLRPLFKRPKFAPHVCNLHPCFGPFFCQPSSPHLNASPPEGSDKIYETRYMKCFNGRLTHAMSVARNSMAICDGLATAVRHVTHAC